jgi:hypothetical protein
MTPLSAGRETSLPHYSGVTSAKPGIAYPAAGIGFRNGDALETLGFRTALRELETALASPSLDPIGSYRAESRHCEALLSGRRSRSSSRKHRKISDGPDWW